MFRYIIICLFLFCGFQAIAQEQDTLFVIKKGLNLDLKYYVKAGETLPMLANRFYVPGETLEKMNLSNPNRKLQQGDLLFIPILKSNFSSIRPPLVSDEYRELFYKVAEKDDI